LLFDPFNEEEIETFEEEEVESDGECIGREEKEVQECVIEALNKEESVKLFKEFILSKEDLIDAFMPWTKIVSLLKNDERFFIIKNDKERETIFNNECCPILKEMRVFKRQESLKLIRDEMRFGKMSKMSWMTVLNDKLKKDMKFNLKLFNIKELEKEYAKI
jgi:hypothetical protein